MMYPKNWARLPSRLETDRTLPRRTGVDLELFHNGKRYEVGPQSKALPGIRLFENTLVVEVIGGNHRLGLATK